MNRRLAGEPFLMVAISADPDERAWRAFLTKEEDRWPQSLDKDRKLCEAFGVDAFPTYVVIDREGIIRWRATGWSSAVSYEVEKALKDAP